MAVLSKSSLMYSNSRGKDIGELSLSRQDAQHTFKESIQGSPIVKSMALLALTFSLLVSATIPAQATDGAAIGLCLLKQCRAPLAKCILNPKCLANVICINTCSGQPNETACQIKCGDLFDNEVIGEFNKCAVSDRTCVPQRPDDGSYPVPKKEVTVPRFDTKLFNGRWFITAGQNELFDIFPCQVHFFKETAPGKFFAQLNWRIEEPDGEFLNRDAVQRFVQDENWPAHLINHDNEYLHYKDDWYVLDYENEGNAAGVPPFALVYYRGSNDAWDGYGGAFVYTKDSKLPESLIPRLRTAVKKVNFDFDKDFTITDNTCKTIGEGEALALKTKFAGKVAIQTEKQLLQQAILARNLATNSVQAQKLFFSNELDQIEKALTEFTQKAIEFEDEVSKKVVSNELDQIEKALTEFTQKASEFEGEVSKKVVQSIPIINKSDASR
eukprot:CAMPEP_0172434226 /NCGR_PEP_ID=MMETSP1064-20121228/70519_1 /TAXON_ID=202472 /ORGANISM="Aulacoseira subarctica , Strain CCAP 1002/5" /LENGTH=440 /DNA_ID=CAMNT_0013182429 /DNA_START=166 /DNA_END=1488 /DNA_ORIENTATION=-